jgi:hypothetical protein
LSYDCGNRHATGTHTGTNLYLTHVELVGLYVRLSEQEEDLDGVQSALLRKISGELYRALSLMEMENIDSYYKRVKEMK